MSGNSQLDIELMRNWIEKNTAAARVVRDDEDLFESQVLDSFSFIQFIYFLEEMLDQEIVLDENIANNFRTLNAICLHYGTSNTAEAGVG